MDPVAKIFSEAKMSAGWLLATSAAVCGWRRGMSANPGRGIPP